MHSTWIAITMAIGIATGVSIAPKLEKRCFGFGTHCIPPFNNCCSGYSCQDALTYGICKADVGTSCGSDSDCYVGLQCQSSVCCAPLTDFCAQNSDCCSGNCFTSDLTNFCVT